MRSRSLFTASALSLLMGCASSMTPVVVPPVPPPAHAMVPCAEIPGLPEVVTMGDLVTADAELAGLYLECAGRHKTLMEHLK